MNALSAPPFPTNPTLGQWHGNWVWNGARWVATPMSGVRVQVTVFNAPGNFPWMPSPGLVSLTVECVGGGGGGGGSQGELNGPPISNTGWMLSGGGGSSGGYSRTTVAAALVAGGVQVVVGAGGAGGTPVAGTAGGTGGTTSFGAFCVANGGNGGGAGMPVSGGAEVGYGGYLAAAGIGDIATYGDAGEHGQAIMYDAGVGQVILWAGRGGGSHFQSANVAAVQSPSGGDGIQGNFGAGGGGGASPYINGPANGGAGGAGLCVITEYCWNDTDGGEVNPPIEVNARVAVTHVPPPCPPNPCPPGWTEFDGD